MSPNKYQVSVATFNIVACAYCAASFVLPPLELSVTPDVGATVTCPAPPCKSSIRVPIGKAVPLFKGILASIALPFVSVTVLCASVKTKLYVVTVCAFSVLSFSCAPLIFLDTKPPAPSLSAIANSSVLAKLLLFAVNWLIRISAVVFL